MSNHSSAHNMIAFQRFAQSRRISIQKLRQIMKSHDIPILQAGKFVFIQNDYIPQIDALLPKEQEFPTDMKLNQTMGRVSALQNRVRFIEQYLIRELGMSLPRKGETPDTQPHVEAEPYTQEH